MTSPGAKMLLAQTALDGHWRGLMVVSRALRDAGFEIVMLGMATADQIAAAAIQEDVALIGLSVGGRVEVVERIIRTVRQMAGDVPIIAGGVLPPYVIRRLDALGVECFPPGSALSDIVAAARRLTKTAIGPAERDSGGRPAQQEP